MYIDKKVRDHNLLQTIARVNRVAKGKSRGYIVDYIGLANHLKDAFSIYSEDDQDDIEGTLKNITTKMPVLESRYQRLISCSPTTASRNMRSLLNRQITDTAEEFDVLEQAVDLMEDIKLRANFEVYLKKFMQSMDIVLPHSAANPYGCRSSGSVTSWSKVKERYKDDSLEYLRGRGEGAQADQRTSDQPGHQPQDSASRAAVAQVHQGGREEHDRPRPRPARWNTPSASTARFISTKTRRSTPS